MDWQEMKLLTQEQQDALRSEGLRETCRRFTEMGKRVVLLASVPTLPSGYSPYQEWRKVKMLKGVDAPEHLTPVHIHQQRSRGYMEQLNALVKDGLAWAVIDSAEALRSGEHYRTRNDAGEFLYSDYTHITYAASDMVGAYIMKEWERLQREVPAEGKARP